MNPIIEAFLGAQSEMTGHKLTMKETKEEAFYTIIPDGVRRCRICKYFTMVPGTEDGAGVCEKVGGIINPEAHCDNFVNHEPVRTARVDPRATT